jgi:uncharacterized protein YciI
MRAEHHILFYTAVPGYVERRQPYREAHLAYANAARDRGELILGGALDDPADGAVLIFKTRDPKIVEDFARDDPYVRNGLIVEWTVRPWIVVIGK